MTVAGMGGPMLQANAAIVPTGQLIVEQGQSADRARVEAVLARDDVRAALESHGVSHEMAKTRVASLSDEEVTKLAGNIDALPAGGFLGAVVFIFLVLLITDILGLTKVFSFTRSVK